MLTVIRHAVAEFAAGDPQRPGWFQYGIEREHVLIGDVGVNLHENRMQAEIGFTLAPAYQGRGYATEAVRRVVGYLLVDQGLLPRHQHGPRWVSVQLCRGVGGE